MKYFLLFLSWFFGLFFLVTGVISILKTPLPALFSIAIACLLLPPVAELIYTKLGRRPTKLQRNLIIVALFLLMGVTSQINRPESASSQLSQPSVESNQ